MKTHILRLGSVVPHGVGGPEAGTMDLIYTFLLQEFELDIYSYIHINQVGDDLNEFVMKEGKKIYINIRYPVYEDFERKSVTEKNSIRLDIIHTALLRLAAEDKKMKATKLEALKNKILEQNFSFHIVYKNHVNKKNKNLIAKVIIHPEEDRFNFYALIEENEREKCRLLIYSGKTTDYYIDALFFYGKWKNINEFIITGKRKEIEIHISIDKCSVEYVNLTSYGKAPFFEMMRADTSKQDRARAHEDWLHSLPPAHAAIIRQAEN